MLRPVLLIVCALLLAACAAKLPYAANAPLTHDVFTARGSTFSGWIPQGWFASTDDTLAPALLVWLIRDDFGATLTVRELKLDRLAARQVSGEGLKLLAAISAGMQDGVSQPVTFAAEPKEFTLRGKTYCSYEIASGIGRKRVVVFTDKGKYFECEAKPLKGSWTAAECSQLFTTQQTVLSLLAF